MSWKGKRVAVTGADGFIGSHLVEHLLEEGAEVRALAYYTPGGEVGWLAPIRDQIEVVLGDVRDGAQMRRFVGGCETVFHLAALIGIPYSYEAPTSYVQVNVEGTQNVLEACLAQDVARVIHTSTSEVYGTARTVPIAEDHPLQPQSPYSASKIGADMMALSFLNAFGLPVSVVRPFNTYGPRQSTRAVIPTILAQLHSGTRQVRLGSTSPTRDFNFVTDTARGFAAVASTEATVGEVVNIGSGREISIGDLVDLLVKISGRQAEVVTDAERMRPVSSEVERLLCDRTKAEKLTGWVPQVSLEEGLRVTSDWVAEHLSRLVVDRYHV